MISAPQAAGPARIWPLVFFYVLAMIVTGVGSVVGLLFAPPPAGAGLLNPTSLPALLIGGETALVSFAFVAAAASRDKVTDRLRLRLPRLPWRRSALLIVATLGVAPLCGSILVLTRTPTHGVMAELGRAVEASSGANAVAIVIAASLFPAVAEELFFRGFLQSRLTQRFGSLVSIFVTSLAFAVFHLDLQQGIFALLLGLWLGALAEVGGSVLLPMAGHLVSNAVAMVHVSNGREARVVLAVGSALFVVSGLVLLVRVWHGSPPAREAARSTSRTPRTRIGLLFAYFVFSLTLFFVACALLGPTLAAMSTSCGSSRSPTRRG